MSRLVSGMRVWNRASGLKHKENGNALLIELDDKTGGSGISDKYIERVLVKTDNNGSYYWWKYKATFPAVNQPNPITTPIVPDHAYNQASKNLNGLRKRAYDRGRF